MARRGPAGIAFGLLASAAALIWAHLAIATLSLCLNETPVLATELAQTAPISEVLARWLLPLSVPVGGGATCDPAAQARAMAVAGLAYVAGIVLLDVGRIRPRSAWALVIGVAAVARAAMLLMPALLSSDIIDYATHGRVASLHGADPYVATPSQFPSDPLSALGAWPNVATVYGPLWTHVDALVTGVLRDANLVQLVLAYKLVALLSDTLSAVLLAWLAVRWFRLGATRVTPVVAVAMWLWNPLVNVELIGNAHNEAAMLTLVLVGLVLLTLALERSPSLLWIAALVCLWLAALVKFVPAAVEAVVALVWLRESNQRLLRFAGLLAALALISLVVAVPWWDSPNVAAPVLGLVNGGQRFKDAWQDAPAAWLTVRAVPLLGIPDDPSTLRMDVARIMVWSVTRALFVLYVLREGWLLWQRAHGPADVVLRGIASASLRILLLALLLYTSQVYAWYFLWPLPMACLLGPRDFWSRAVVVFGLTFLPAYYLREFQPYGVFEMPRYAEVSLLILAVVWLVTRVRADEITPRFGAPGGASTRSEAVQS